jgi:hypothetical protein
MRLRDFEAMVRHQAAEIPAEFLEGIAEIIVSPRTVSHPDRPGVWTLGECIPLPLGEADSRHWQSRVVLYHGSFHALAGTTGDFDWKREAWETLTHELRHHMEWKARVPDLEAFDEAAEENFARQEGAPFDPMFYRDAMRRADGAFQVDDDVFIERVMDGVPEPLLFSWGGVQYRIAVPPGLTLPAYLSVDGVRDPPPGELILVLVRRTGVMDLFRRPAVFQATVEAAPAGDYLSPEPS